MQLRRAFASFVDSDRTRCILIALATSLLISIPEVSSQLDLPPLQDDRLDRDRQTGRLNPRVNVDNGNVLAQLEFLGAGFCGENVAAQWAYETNSNEATQAQALEAQLRYAEFQHHSWRLISNLDRSNIQNPAIFRRLEYLSVVGPAALPPDQLNRYNRIINDMLSIYNDVTICSYNDPFRCDLRLYPDIAQIMAKSKDWDELQYVWTEWRRRNGVRMRELYQQLIQINNDAARLNNFTDAAEYWMFPYQSANFEQEIEDVWRSIRPLYTELHAYVRRKLRDLYGPEKINPQAPLPSHVLGNIWAQSWTNILDLTMPYPGKAYPDVTPEMRAQGYTPIYMFQVAEEFFLSLNLSAMPPEFWAGSIVEDPGDRNLICQASAWDFCNGLDYRIKMCTRVTMKDLFTVHHEMAHIQYFLRYRHLPREFRDGANPGFHEAVGEAVVLSVSSPRHLQTLGLATKYIDEPAADINYLFALAMEKVVGLPFAIAMDKWRWDVFRGVANRENYNCHWHRLRERYSGLKPPVLRSEDDFDPGSKYHVPANVPYIRNFVAGVLQFQLFRSLCRAASQRYPDIARRPLHKCDFYRSPEAGRVLGRLMEKGSSLQWQETLQDATGETRLDGEALREYFRPLEDWLRAENLRTGEIAGWSYDGDYCKRSIQTAGLQIFGGGFYNSASNLFGRVQKIVLAISTLSIALLSIL
ncbi:angiotensin-converting enzyme [Orussus abietinus]|uniref:angiotensin-converting enzyme n=1 Tax=Orussus abietinus TaxID=222816 RepID=UPI0006260944|nr:angiotensin-converting enzyme [Orussus abietinus]